jgi:hypothetical protein
LDILLANQPGGDLAVYINDGNGNFQHLYRVGTGYRPSGIVYEDFTGNGVKDVGVICSPATSGVGINYVNILEGIGGTVSVDEIIIKIPDQYELFQNYPNPFNPSTKITFTLPEASQVKLTVFNILGEEVKTLINENRDAGHHTVDFNASGFSSGVYLYKIQAGNFVQVRKMILTK